MVGKSVEVWVERWDDLKAVQKVSKKDFRWVEKMVEKLVEKLVQTKVGKKADLRAERLVERMDMNLVELLDLMKAVRWDY